MQPTALRPQPAPLSAAPARPAVKFGHVGHHDHDHDHHHHHSHDEYKPVAPRKTSVAARLQNVKNYVQGWLLQTRDRVQELLGRFKK